MNHIEEKREKTHWKKRGDTSDKSTKWTQSHTIQMYIKDESLDVISLILQIIGHSGRHNMSL